MNSPPKNSPPNLPSVPAPTPSRYWRRTRHLTILLLLCWGMLGFGSLYFARELSALTIFGWPVSFYLAAQGLTLSYVLILAVYSVCMRWIQRSTS
ncbi:DUF4212 domain-containing protein [Undibacterium oligocarboniphilum]|uniref:DUF4212 domain-containing protein n=1 Tax=Undibacterium oligocarboniphilum TaxID=666702 RepID=A0A850QM60_9BURK|nr:DUF4212 domain-containing protein [Undibacterium oligocarboniphilum]MBC3870725.1 DUF4212 domain-containing protein [Undibacterium oligocarboniphilum]NVO78473.1 DUF4212 domain-containing protein [Undibacterium oligocarboniphilum]